MLRQHQIIKFCVFVSYVGQLFDSLLISCLSLWLLAGEQRKHISGEHCAATNECDPSVCVCSGLLFAINCGHKKETKKKIKTQISSKSKMQQQAAEVKLFNNPKEREMYENMADLFSILKTTEHLEKAHMRDAITPEE